MINEPSSIIFPCEKNIAGVLFFDFAPTTFVEDFSPIKDIQNILLMAPVFKLGKDWLSGMYLPKISKVKYGHDLDRRKSGDVFKHRLEGVIPSHDPMLERNLSIISKYRHLIRLKELNGKYVLLGTTERPLEFKYKFTNDGKVGGFRGYEFEFSADINTPPSFLP